MNLKLYLVILSTALLLSHNSQGQITAVDINPTKDAQAYSGSPTSNYGSSSVMSIWLSAYIIRTFIEADLTSIPANAIIISADLQMEVNAFDNSPSHPFYLDRINQSWSEGSITWNNQPSVTTSDQVSIPHENVSVGTVSHMDVKDQVQYMVNYPDLNYGWRIRMQNEGSGPCGVQYHSAEATNSLDRPVLSIEYVVPMQINGYVTHCTNGNSDGVIDASVSLGVGTYDSYEWFKFDSGYAHSIESGSDIADVDVEGLDPGLYLLHVEDDSGYVAYRYFLVGEEGEETVVSMYANDSDTSSMYWKDAFIYDRTGYTDLNYGDYIYYNATYNPITPLETKSLLEFEMDFDFLLEFNAATFELNFPTGTFHYRGSEYDNEIYARLLTSSWEESWVTWNTKPSISAGIIDSIPQTAPGNGYTDAELDLISAVQYWQDNPEDNYGLVYELADPLASTGNWLRQVYGSSDHTTAADRPKFEIAFEVKESIITEFIDSTGLGSIEVNSPNGLSPYTYLISLDTLPIMDTLWSVFKDSIVVDSATFWGGKTYARNFKYENLPPTKYFVGIYDDNGKIIFNEAITITPSIEIYDSTDITVDGDTLKVLSPAVRGDATLLLSLPEEENGGFGIQIVDLDDDIQIGFNNESDPFPSTSEDYEFSFDIRTTGKVYFMMSDSIIDSTTVTTNDELKLIKENGSVYAHKNETSFADAEIEVSSRNTWKVDAQLKGTNAKLFISVVFGQLLLPKINYDVNDPNCSSNQGSITINSTGFSFFSIQLSAYTIKDESGATVASGSGVIPLPTTINLAVGVYTIHCSYSVGLLSGSMYEQFVVGYPVNWNITSGLTESTTSIQIKPSLDNIPGYAVSGNTTISSYLNWMAFKSPAVIDSAFGYSANVIGYENISTEYPIKIMVYHPNGSVLTRWVVVLDKDNVIQNFFIVNDDRVFKVELTDDGGTTIRAKLYYDNVLKSDLITSVSGDLKIDLAQYGKMPLNDSKVNFCAERNPYVAKTKPFTDGSYYTTISGVVDFQYTGEYNQSDLIYELTDINGDVILTGNYDLDVTGSTGAAKKNADNRYTIDIGGQAAGYYLLTITNVKGEKHFLRIKN